MVWHMYFSDLDETNTQSQSLSTTQTHINLKKKKKRQTLDSDTPESTTVVTTACVLISGMYVVGNVLLQVSFFFFFHSFHASMSFIDSCVCLCVCCLCFRVRWPAPAGHAEPHGEEEAGIHPWAHRHWGELRQRSAACHRGKHTDTATYTVCSVDNFAIYFIIGKILTG